MTEQDPALSNDRIVHEAGDAAERVHEADIAMVSQQVHHVERLQVVPKLIFLEQLSRERARTDRSKAPLSLLIIEVNADSSHDCKNLESVLRVLRSCLREVDSVGFLETSVLAVMLPDTDSKGAGVVADKILTHDGGPIASVVRATYPDTLFDRLQLEEAGAGTTDPSLFLAAQPPRPVQSSLKRLIDVFGALAGLIALSPFMLLIMVLIKLTSPGPIIFRQIRLGKDLVPFTFYKFRSMYSGSDDSVHRKYLENLIKGSDANIDQDSNGDAFYKIKSDSRVTRIGGIIRKTSIDELPQLVNVLKGEMSLVGPRPPIPYEAKNYQSWHLRRILEVKPGLTGLWQVEGRSKTTFDEMVRMDLYYSRKWSVLLDIKLILRTFKVVLECKGAV